MDYQLQYVSRPAYATPDEFDVTGDGQDLAREGKRLQEAGVPE
jgi:hypothetical protein